MKESEKSIEGSRASFTVKADLCGNDGEEKKRGGYKRGKNEQEGSCDGEQDGHRTRAKGKVEKRQRGFSFTSPGM